jgi:hypothetical protein
VFPRLAAETAPEIIMVPKKNKTKNMKILPGLICPTRFSNLP